ncbi:MAG: hypothetical protein AAF721_20500 [Myxococcota bacterium]
MASCALATVVACGAANPAWAPSAVGDSETNADTSGGVDDGAPSTSAGADGETDASTSEAPDTTNVVDTTDTAETTETGETVSACCDAQPIGNAGCESSPAIEACVCEYQPLCCQDGWEPHCVQLAVNCGLECPGHQSDQACCAVGAGPGCVELPVTQCVCDVQPECCSVQWDSECVEIAGDECGAECGDPIDDCCASKLGGLGCGDPDTEACVCADNPFCCDFAWDNLCVFNAQVCGAGCFDGGECCVAGVDAGCFDDAGGTATQECVCQEQPECCTTLWDDECAMLAGSLCNACG